MQLSSPCLWLGLVGARHSRNDMIAARLCLFCYSFGYRESFAFQETHFVGWRNSRPKIPATPVYFRMPYYICYRLNLKIFSYAKK